MPRLPNFFIAGAPKAGTTSLYHYLDQHPQVFMSAVKEPNFFAAEIREENCEPEIRRRGERDRVALRRFLDGPMLEKRFGGIVTEWDDYVRLFAGATNESALGEASVCYLWSKTAAEAIAEKIPDARILVMLRDPSDRAFSQYLHGLSVGVIRGSFRDSIGRNLRHSSERFSPDYPCLEFGLYADQLQRFQRCFGRNVWVGFYEDFKNRPAGVFHDICRFLEIDPEFSPDMAKRHLEGQPPRVAAVGWLKRSGWWRAAARLTPARVRPLARRTLVRKPGTARMDPADRQFLVDFYRQDILKLRSLLNRNLDGWLK